MPPWGMFDFLKKTLDVFVKGFLIIFDKPEIIPALSQNRN